MAKDYRGSTVVALSVAVLMVLATAVPAGAQIHEFGRKLLGAQGRMSATTLGGSTHGDKNSTGSTCSCAECIYLDTYDPTNPASGDLIASTTTTLQKGVPYLITIKGTYSVWAVSWWVGNGQGASEAAPQYPSPGTTNGRVASDWEYLFAWYMPTTPAISPLPVHVPYQGISLDGGITYNDYVPLGGQLYSPSHVYQYLVEGQGSQAFFKKNDYPTSDNYGQFRICVQKLNPCGSIKDDNGGGDDGNPGGHS